MASPAELYIKGVRAKTKYYAAWLPNAILKLGDIGILEGGTYFIPQTNLMNLGVNFSVIQGDSPMSFDLQSDRGVQTTNKIAGSIDPKAPNIPQAQAGVAVDFSATGAFIIKAPNTTQSIISDIVSLGIPILNLFKQGKWNKNWVVIDTLITAPSATIMISESSTGKIELTANAQIAAGKTVQLGDVNVDFGVSFTSGDVINMNAVKDITPLFKLFGVKPGAGPTGIIQPKKGMTINKPENTAPIWSRIGE